MIYKVYYTFTGNGNWDDSTNWQNNKMPTSPILANSIIIINSRDTGECIINIPIVIPPTCSLNIMEGKKIKVIGDLNISARPVSNMTLLTTYLFLDTAVAHPYDTIARTNYYYDDLNRIIKIDRTEIDPYAADPSNTEFSLIDTFYYNGNDTLAYKKIHKYISYISGYYASDTTEYAYYTDGKMKKDSFYSPNSISVDSFTYTFDSIYINAKGSNSFQTNYSFRKLFQTKITGVITYQQDSTFNEGARVSRVINTSYIPNPNPFYKIGSANRSEIQSPNLGGINYGDEVPKRLITEQRAVANLSWGENPFYLAQNDKVNYTYSFRSDGYPNESFVTYSDILNNDIRIYKLIFIYNR